MSPHGVFQLPKSALSLSLAEARDCNSCSPDTLPATYSSAETPTFFASILVWRRISSPQNTARDVGTDDADHLWSHARRSSICGASCAFRGFVSGVSSHALITAGSGLSNHGR